MSEQVVRVTAVAAMAAGTVGAAVPDLRERLAASIRQRGLSQKRLAELSGVSEPNISKMLSGRTVHPTSEQISRLARALDVPTDYLIGADCPPTEADLPLDLRQQIAAMPHDYRRLVSELISQGHKLPDTKEGRAAFEQAIRVAVGYLQSVIEEGE